MFTKKSKLKWVRFQAHRWALVIRVFRSTHLFGCVGGERMTELRMGRTSRFPRHEPEERLRRLTSGVGDASERMRHLHALKLEIKILFRRNYKDVFRDNGPFNSELRGPFVPFPRRRVRSHILIDLWNVKTFQISRPFSEWRRKYKFDECMYVGKNREEIWGT
jgi:hypothetical protein